MLTQTASHFESAAAVASGKEIGKAKGGEDAASQSTTCRAHVIACSVQSRFDSMRLVSVV